MISMEHVERLRADGVLFRGHLDAGRRLVRLALPSVLVHVPLATLSLLALMMTAGGSAALVNQRFQLIGTSDAPLLTWTVVLAAVALAGDVVVFPATVVIAAGHLVDRHVPPIEALRATVRRLPSLLVLLGVAAPVFGASWAARAGVLMATDQRWQADALLVVVAYAAMPVLLAVPGVLLHGCSGLGSIRRAYQLTRLRFLPTAWTLALGVVLIPGAVAWALHSGLLLLPGPLATLGWGLAGTVLVLAVTPFQAAVVARQFLHCMAWRTQVDDSDLAHGLPDGPPPRPLKPRFPTCGAAARAAVQRGCADQPVRVAGDRRDERDGILARLRPHSHPGGAPVRPASRAHRTRRAPDRGDGRLPRPFQPAGMRRPLMPEHELRLGRTAEPRLPVGGRHVRRTTPRRAAPADQLDLQQARTAHLRGDQVRTEQRNRRDDPLAAGNGGGDAGRPAGRRPRPGLRRRRSGKR
ncbi:hypothetical protein ACWDA3_23825 [Nonomuraea rubra]